MWTAFRTTLTALILVSSATIANSAEWKISPVFVLRAGYDDNVRLSIDNKVSSAKVTFSPSARFSVMTPQSGATGTLRFNFRRFEADSDLNDDNLRLDTALFHTMEHSRVGLNLDFIKDTTLDSQLEETGLVFDRTPRERINVGPNWNYSFNERTRVSLSYNYSDVNYKNADGTGLFDFTVHSSRLSLLRTLSSRTTASISLSRSRSSSDNDVQSTNINLQGGASYQFSETFSAAVFAGIRSTETDTSRTSLQPIRAGLTIIGFVPLNQSVTNNSLGSTFNVSINKTFLRGAIGLSASRNISNDFNGQPIEVTRISSNALYRFSDTLSTNLKLEFTSSQSNNNVGSSLNREYYQVEPTFSWAMKKFWSLSGSYRYRRQTFDSVSKDAIQNAAYLTLNYRWPRIAVSR